MTERHTIDSFKVVGINYKKTDASVRGLFAVNQEQYARLLAMATEYGINDLFIVSTCNRTEVYCFAESTEQVADLMCSVCAGDKATFLDICYTRTGNEAISHLYHVAAGLDSQILGDLEIMGQIKAAVKVAKMSGFICPYMERLLNSVMQASKAVTAHTELSGGTVSVSFAAVQCIRKYVEERNVDVKTLKIALVGTGKIGRVTCRNMVDYLGTRNITLLNRTEATALELAADMGLRTAPLSALPAEVKEADVLLISTNAPQPILQKEHLENAGDKLVIDISVPCNVAKEAQVLPGIRFVDVDGLSKVTDETLQKRREEVPKAVAIINEHIADFNEWCAMRRHAPLLKEVKSKLMDLQPEGATEEYEEKVHKAISRLATKVRRNDTPGCHYIQAINDLIAQ